MHRHARQGLPLQRHRLLHWTPSLRTETHMQTSSRTRVLEIAATISYFTARNIRLDTESSKLLVLSPHNDTIIDLEDALGAPDTDLPPTLYDFYLVTLYRLHFLASRLDEFPKRNHNNQEVTPHPNSITNLAIFAHIKDDAPLILELETLATLPTIISIAIDFPRYFTSYCTLSNTVKAIGIGGTASLFLSVKMSRFLADSKEAEARNLVALTRTGEDLAQGVGFWYAFLTSFWGAKTMVLSKREGLLPGPGLALSFWFPFFLELWLLYFLLSWCFFGRYLGCNSVPGQGLDSCVVVLLSFLLLFWLALSLLSWSLFCSLLLCSWVPGTRVGSLRGRFSSC